MRLREFEESELNDAQLTVYRNIASGPRGGVRGPFNIMLRSPEMADRVQKLGEYLRFDTVLSERINEFAIIITARYWSSEIEWRGHSKRAIAAGLSADVAAQLAQGQRPTGMQEDEAATYEFCTQLHETKEVSDAAYNEALKHFGEQGVMDMIGVSGYYTLVAMVLKVSQKPLPAGTPNALPPLK